MSLLNLPNFKRRSQKIDFAQLYEVEFMWVKGREARKDGRSSKFKVLASKLIQNTTTAFGDQK